MVKVVMLRESYSSENKAVRAGDVIEVTEARAKDLVDRRKVASRDLGKAKELRAAEKAKPGRAKAARVPPNKKAPEGENKGAGEGGEG